HQAVLGIARRVVDADVLPVRLELLGDDLRQRRADALAHLRLRDVHGDEAVGRDRDRGVRIVRGGSVGGAGADEREADRERAGGRGRSEERASREGVFHERTPCAARLIARLILGYVAQRQMLPDIAVTMSWSLGFGLRASSAAADMSCPDWQ